MSNESPPSLRASLRSRTGLAVVVLFILLSLYAILIQAQILAVVYFASLALLFWLLYRFVRAHERIAVAQERRAAAVGDDTAAATVTADGVDRPESPPASGVAEPSDEADGDADREE